MKAAEDCTEVLGTFLLENFLSFFVSVCLCNIVTAVCTSYENLV